MLLRKLNSRTKTSNKCLWATFSSSPETGQILHETNFRRRNLATKLAKQAKLESERERGKEKTRSRETTRITSQATNHQLLSVSVAISQKEVVFGVLADIFMIPVA